MRRVAILAMGGLTLVLVAWLGIPLLLVPSFRSPLGATPAAHGLAFETVRIEAGSSAGELAAWWIPAEEGRAIVVLLHDGSSNRSFLWSGALGLARVLTLNGYHVLAPDLRGHGESAEHTGAPLGRDLAPDVSAWIDYAESRAGPLPVVVHGYGLGGQVAIYAGASDRRIAAVVADSTWADLRTSLEVSLPAVTPLPRALLPPLMWSAEHVHGIDFSKSRAVEVAPELGRRLLLIHNEEDPQVPRRQLRWLAAAAEGSEVWLTPAPLPDHPLYAERGSWGTHTSSYRLHPDAYATRVLAFYAHRVAEFGSRPSRSAKGRASKRA